LLFVLSACGNTTAPTKTEAHHAPSEGHAGHSGHSGHGHHHRFDDAVKWTKVFDDPERDAWQKPARVVEVMAITPGMTVADIGAGTGYFEPHLSRAVGASGKVIAEDVEPDMVKWITERAKRESLGNVTAVLGSATDPKLGGASTVDRILIVDTWHHVDDRSTFAKNLAASLKAGGSVFIVDFTMDSPHGPPRPARILPEAVARDLELAGLSTSIMKDAGLPHQYIVRGTRGSAGPSTAPP
jgi:SAM-dependent methyltransferase